MSSISENAVRRCLARDERVVAVLEGDGGGEAHVDLRPKSPRAVEVRNFDGRKRLFRRTSLSEASDRLSVLSTMHRYFTGTDEMMIAGSKAVVVSDRTGIGWQLDVRAGTVSARCGRPAERLPVTLRYPEDFDVAGLQMLADLDVDVYSLLQDAPLAQPPTATAIAERLDGAQVRPLPPIATVPRPIALVFPWLWCFGAEEDLSQALFQAFPAEGSVTGNLADLLEPEIRHWAETCEPEWDPRARAATTALNASYG